MSSLLCLVAIVAQAAAPAVLENLQVDVLEDGALVRIAVRGAPSFTTEEAEGAFVIDFVGVKSSLADVEKVEASGLLGIRQEGREDGHRMRILLEPGAQAEPRMEEGALVIRILAGPKADPAEALAAAMAGLATQVARIGESVRELSGTAGGAEPTADATEPGILAMDLSEPEPAPAPAAAEPATEASAEAEVAKEDEPGADAVVATEPLAGEAMAEAEVAPEVEATEPAAPATEAPSVPAEAAPHVVAAVASPSPRREGAQQVAAAVARTTSELVRLGFRRTPNGALVLLVMEGDAEPRLDHQPDRVVVELPGTRIRRANDKRPLDASFFGTPVGVIRAVEDRSGTTRLEIQLVRPAEVTLERLGDEIAIALGEAS